MPVSTTHVISSAIMGTGASDRFNAVHWGVARRIGIAWVLTIPASGLVAALSYLVLRPILVDRACGQLKKMKRIPTTTSSTPNARWTTSTGSEMPSRAPR